MIAPPDTDERNRSLEERVSRLEGGYEHLATKADVERVLVAVERVLIELERVRTEVERNKADTIKLIIQLAGIGAALMAAGFAFLRITGAG